MAGTEIWLVQSVIPGAVFRNVSVPATDGCRTWTCSLAVNSSDFEQLAAILRKEGLVRRGRSGQRIDSQHYNGQFHRKPVSAPRLNW